MEQWISLMPELFCGTDWKGQADFKTCLFFRHGKRFLCQIGIGRT